MRGEPNDAEMDRIRFRVRLAVEYEQRYQEFCRETGLDPESIDAVTAYEDEVQYQLERME